MYIKSFIAFERDVKAYGKELKRNAVIRLFVSELGFTRIEKKPAKAVSKRLSRLTLEWINNKEELLNISVVSNIIAPIIEYKIVDIKEVDHIEHNSLRDIYNIIVEFKKKDGVVPVSMSITDKGEIVGSTVTVL